MNILEMVMSCIESCCNELLDVLASDIYFEVDSGAYGLGGDSNVVLGVADHSESERIIINIAYGQTRSIHGNVSLWDNILHHRLVASNRVPERIFFLFDFVDGPSAIDVTLDNMPPILPLAWRERSRLTPDSVERSPRLVLRIVSGASPNVNPSPGRLVTVKQVPFTLILSPRTTPSNVKPAVT
eukprot:CAMPEP_0184739500 /NCGR_PEP_ID=MMETSP0315-20130426/2394_1 /TAXON_ID=101924 /ORGANISM="Rhodosorus marinus, Strain UTEX LB 2760" /LENGTH=183 /DNA_ID=CAMNT_0027208385 /DNA_START=198 /DNA_END=750 /DNA_ORIENTATION=-